MLRYNNYRNEKVASGFVLPVRYCCKYIRIYTKQEKQSVVTIPRETSYHQTHFSAADQITSKHRRYQFFEINLFWGNLRCLRYLYFLNYSL